MASSKSECEHLQKYYAEFPKAGLAVDLSRMNVSDEFFARMEPRIMENDNCQFRRKSTIDMNVNVTLGPTIQSAGRHKSDNGNGIRIAVVLAFDDLSELFSKYLKQLLTEIDRESMTVTVNDISPIAVGKLIVLFERAVGFYAPLIGINPYPQPSIEAGKKAVEKLIELQKKVITHFLNLNNPDKLFTIQEIANVIGEEEDAERVFKIIHHLVANSHHRVRKILGPSWLGAKYGVN